MRYYRIVILLFLTMICKAHAYLPESCALESFWKPFHQEKCSLWDYYVLRHEFSKNLIFFSAIPVLISMHAMDTELQQPVSVAYAVYVAGKHYFNDRNLNIPDRDGLKLLIPVKILEVLCLLGSLLIWVPQAVQLLHSSLDFLRRQGRGIRNPTGLAWFVSLYQLLEPFED